MRLLDRHDCTERLRLIFPPGVVEDTRAASGPLAGAAVYVGIYCGAFDGHNPVRPSLVLWMCDGVAQRAVQASPEELATDRERWYRAALRGHASLTALLTEWAIDHRQWYADNSREPLRDETFRAWLRFGAMSQDTSVPTTSPRPSWSLRGDFATLFRPGLAGDELAEAIRLWQDANLGTVGRARVRLETDRQAAAHGVEARLPNGSVRPLATGDSSLILKQDLLRWAAERGITAGQCGFLTGFLSRTHAAFRRRVASLAWGTHAWFLDEPERIVRLDDLPERKDG